MPYFGAILRIVALCWNNLTPFSEFIHSAISMFLIKKIYLYLAGTVVALVF